MAPTRALPEFIPDRVLPAASADGVEFWIYSVFPKEGWVAHSAGGLTRVDHPGSAIQYGEKIYELMRAEETLEEGYRFRYGLRGWDSRNAIRHLESYTLEAQFAHAVSHLHAVKTERLRNCILWLFPIAGFAPNPLQREWENKTGLKMAWVSLGSALFGLALAFLMRGASGNTRFQDVVLYLAIESFVRLFWIGIFHKPQGAFLLTAGYLLWQGIARKKPRTHAAEPLLDPLKWQDEVVRGAGQGSLQIRSRFFDPYLTGSTPVSFEGAVYRPLGWNRSGKGLSRRWTYELEKIEPDPGSQSRDFTVPRTPDRQKAVEQFTHRYDLAQSFALFWSIYPRRDQLRLQILYQYDGPRATAVTAGMFLALGIVQLCLAAALLRVTTLAMIGPAYLILESTYRLYKAKGLGLPAGSVIGYALRLVIRPPK
jgi:hypothetical protein